MEVEKKQKTTNSDINIHKQHMQTVCVRAFLETLRHTSHTAVTYVPADTLGLGHTPVWKTYSHKQREHHKVEERPTVIGRQMDRVRVNSGDSQLVRVIVFHVQVSANFPC